MLGWKKFNCAIPARQSRALGVKCARLAYFSGEWTTRRGGRLISNCWGIIAKVIIDGRGTDVADRRA